MYNLPLDIVYMFMCLMSMAPLLWFSEKHFICCCHFIIHTTVTILIIIVIVLSGKNTNKKNNNNNINCCLKVWILLIEICSTSHFVKKKVYNSDWLIIPPRLGFKFVSIFLWRMQKQEGSFFLSGIFQFINCVYLYRKSDGNLAVSVTSNYQDLTVSVHLHFPRF